MAKRKNLQVIGYVRVSVDEVDKISPDVQRKAIADYCAKNDWQLVDTIVERGRSAGEGKHRPGFDRVRDAVNAKTVSALVVYRLDRATRSVADFADLWRDLDEAGCEFVSVSEGFDTTTPMGKAMLQIATVFAELERGIVVERTKAVHRYRRSQNFAPNGTPTYGYRRVGTTLVVEPVEAEWLRAIVAWLLDGMSLRKVCARLEAEDAPLLPKVRENRDKQIAAAAAKGEAAPTFKSTAWRFETLRNLVNSPIIAGLRLDPDSGALIEGGWEPIIDPATWRRLHAVMSDPARRTSSSRTPTLLSGIVLCGRCGAPLRPHRRRGVLRYRCAKSDYNRDACQGLSIDMAALDEYVTGVLFDRTEGIRLPIENVADDVDDPDELRDQLDELATMYGTGDLSVSEWQAARRPLLERVAAVEGVAQRHERSHAVTSLLGGGDLRATWDRLTITDRRAVLRQVLPSAPRVNTAATRGADVASRVTFERAS